MHNTWTKPLSFVFRTKTLGIIGNTTLLSQQQKLPLNMYSVLSQGPILYTLYQVGSPLTLTLTFLNIFLVFVERESVGLTKVGVHHIQKQRDSYK